MRITFNLISTSSYRAFYLIRNVGWLLLVIVFIVAFPGGVLGYNLFGKIFYISFMLGFFVLFFFLFFIVKSRLLISKHKKIEFFENYLKVQSSLSKIKVYDENNVKRIEVYHTSEFKRLSEEADVDDGLVNFLIVYEYDSVSKYQFQINSKEANKTFQQLITKWKQDRYNIEYFSPMEITDNTLKRLVWQKQN